MLSDDGRKLLTSCRSLVNAYNDYVRENLKRSGIDYDFTPNEIVVLSSLQTKATQSLIAAENDVSKALVSRSVKALKDKKLITVAKADGDRREQDISLTEQGKELSDLIDRINGEFYSAATFKVNGQMTEVTELVLNLMLQNLSKES